VARALYSRPDVLLLDDPLSAVDSKVAAAMLHRFIAPPPRQTTALPRQQDCFYGRTQLPLRILVTHHDHVAAAAHCHILLGGVDSGSPSGAVVVHQEPLSLPLSAIHGGDDNEAAAVAAADSIVDAGTDTPRPAAPDVAAGVEAVQVQATPTPSQAAATDEVHGGDVPSRIYHLFFRAAWGSKGIALAAALLVATVVCNNATQFVLTLWTDAASDAPNGIVSSRLPSLYALLTVLSLVCSIIAAAVIFVGLAWAATHLHDAAITRVMAATLDFLNNTPVGALLNRFSRDVGTLDDSLPFTAFEYIHGAISLVGTLALVGYVNPYILLSLLPLGLLFVRIRRRYLLSCRALKRIEAATRSPLYGRLSDYCNADGLVCIRAFGMAPHFLASFFAAVDANVEAVFNMMAVSRWLGFAMDAMCVLLLTAAVAACIPLRDTLPPALVGLALSQVMATVNGFQW